MARRRHSIAARRLRPVAEALIVPRTYAYGSFTSQGPVTALGASLKAWLDPDDHGTARMTDDGAGAISSHTSKDGSALTVTAATTARPTWSASAISGPPGSFAGLTFDGVANCLVSTTLTNIPTGSTAGEIWVLVNSTQAPGTASYVVGCGGVPSTAISRNIRHSGATPSRVVISDGPTLITDAAAGNPSFQGVHVVSGNWSGTTEAGSIDGVLLRPESATIASLTTSTTRIRIGSDNAATAANFFGGVVRHVFIVTTLTALQRQQLPAWSLWDVGYRPPQSSPFRSRRP